MKLSSEITKKLYDICSSDETLLHLKINITNWYGRISKSINVSTNGFNIFELPDSYMGLYGVLFSGEIIESNFHFTESEQPNHLLVARTVANSELVFFIPNNKELVQSISDFIDDNYLVSYRDLSDFIDAQTVLYNI